jgi:hypothetical protein
VCDTWRYGPHAVTTPHHTTHTTPLQALFGGAGGEMHHGEIAVVCLDSAGDGEPHTPPPTQVGFDSWMDGPFLCTVCMACVLASVYKERPALIWQGYHTVGMYLTGRAVLCRKGRQTSSSL